MKVREIMRGFVKVDARSTITMVASIMEKESASSVLVDANGTITGIVTERDIVRKVVARKKNPDRLTAADIMNSPILTIDCEEDVMEASKMMAKHKIRHLAVVENGKIIGKVTAELISTSFKYALARDIMSYGRVEYNRHVF